MNDKELKKIVKNQDLKLETSRKWNKQERNKTQFARRIVSPNNRGFMKKKQHHTAAYYGPGWLEFMHNIVKESPYNSLFFLL